MGLLETFQSDLSVNETERVLVIGGGAAGLAALGAIANEGKAECLLVERAERIGGVWNQTSYPGLATHIKSFVYRFYNFHAPRTRTAYASREEVLAYFDEYVQDRGLGLRIVCGVRVEGILVRREEGRRACIEVSIHTADGHARLLKVHRVICALGFSSAGAPHLPDLPGRGEYQGEILHASQFSGDAMETVKRQGDRVCLVGGGKSAYDIGLELHREGVASRSVWVCRKRMWGLNHEFVYSDDPNLFDVMGLSGEYFYRLRRAPDDPATEALGKRLKETRLFLNLDRDEPLHQFRGAHYREGELESLRRAWPRRRAAIVALNAEGVTLDTGERIQTEWVLFATGYERAGNLIPIRVLENGTESVEIDLRDQGLLYRGMIDPRVPEILFFTGEQTFPHQLYGFSFCSNWVKLYISRDSRVCVSPAEMFDRLEQDEFVLNGGVDARYRYRWLPGADQNLSGGAGFSSIEASAYYQKQVLGDLGIPPRIQTRLNFAQYDRAAFERANSDLRNVMDSSLGGNR